MQLCSWNIFHLNSFRASKIASKNWFAEGQKKCTRQKASLPSARKKGTQQRRILLSAEKWHSGRVPKKRHSAKTHFAECRKMALGKIHLCRVPKKKHSAKPYLPSAKKNTRQSRLCRVPNKIHSTKLPALGKVPVSTSVYYTKPRVNYLFEALTEFKSKSGQLQSFISFRDLQFSFRKFFHPRSFEKFEISNLRDSNVVLHDKMISNQKVVNYIVS